MYHERARVIIRGLVQGVGFRHSLWREARRRSLSGWVRNKPDGSVEALFQGDRNSVENIIDWCYRGPVLAHVHEVEVSWEKLEQDFDSFNIIS